MMMMRPGSIPQWRAVEGAVLAIAMTMMTARVRRTRRGLRKDRGNGREHRVERRNRRRLSMENGTVLPKVPGYPSAVQIETDPEGTVRVTNCEATQAR
jgi:hypothetical protein